MIDFSIIDKIIVLLINIIGIWLAFWVLLSGRTEKAKQLFFLTTILIILWINVNFLSNLPSQYSNSLLWNKLIFGIVSLVFIALYFFSIYFPKKISENRLLDKIVIILCLFLFIISVFSNLIISGVTEKEWGTEIVFGNAQSFYYLSVIFLTGVIIYNLNKKNSILIKQEQHKIQYVLAGLYVFALANLVFNVAFVYLFDSVQFGSLGEYSIIFFLIFTAYAIVKHELLGIRSLFTQVLIVIMTIILIVDIVLLSDNLLILLLKIAVLITFLYFSREMIISVKKEKESKAELEKAYEQINHYVDQLEEMNTDLAERNEDLKALLEASGKASEALDPKKIAQDIVDSIPKNLKHLGYIGGMIALYDKDTQVVQPYTITKSKLIEKILTLLNKPFEKNIAKIGNADNFISRTIIEKQIFSGDNLAEFIAPTIKKSTCDIMQKTLRANSIITIPLISRGRANGIILFVGKRSIKEVAQRDKDMLYMFSSHVGAAIENAKLYEQTSEQIKEMAKLNRKLESANENLKELLEMKNEFLHITSHQLRTPLTAIRGMLSMWYDGDFDNLSEAEKRDILKRIYMSTERLNNITNDMLDALEIEGGLLRFQFNYVSIKDIVKETIDTLKNNYDKKGLYIKFSADEDLPQVKVEPNYIRQVFMNVIDNASKYTKTGGVDIKIVNNGKYVETIIKDTGVGASKEDQKKLFEKFTRGKNAVKENASGSGLGLFIAKKIVEKHHGKMTFFSEGIGKGSTIKISLLSKKNSEDEDKQG